LLGHLREAGLIRGETFFPAFFFQIIFSGHRIRKSLEVRGLRLEAKTLSPHTSNLTPQALI
jgi:hypothetical protein